MVYKGIVMEVTRNYCVILTNSQEFIKIKIKKGIYESQEIYFTESDIYSQKSYAKWTFSAAIVLICLFLSGIQIHQLYPSIYSHNAAIVSIDINPSIEFYIDEDKNVTKVKPLNEDASSLVSDNWEGHAFRMVLNEYLNSAIEKGYLKQESTVLMSCASLNDDFNKEIIKKEVNRAIHEKNVSDITYGYIESNKENVKKAEDANISIGKYEIYDDIKDTNQDMDTIEKVKNVKVSELIEETEEVKIVKKKGKNIKPEEDINKKKPEKKKPNNQKDKKLNTKQQKSNGNVKKGNSTSIPNENNESDETNIDDDEKDIEEKATDQQSTVNDSLDNDQDDYEEDLDDDVDKDGNEDDDDVDKEKENNGKKNSKSSSKSNGKKSKKNDD